MADKKSNDCTKIIELTGIVQGVGFRPFVYRLAKLHGLTGHVKNISGRVRIVASGGPDEIDAFLRKIQSDAPGHAKIEDIAVFDAPYFFAEDFTVIKSDESVGGQRFFSPDLALCDDCKREIFDVDDRRFGHHFNSCVSCGPRFSILLRFPYDRENTSMGRYVMCPDCEKEYADQEDRRFHAETIACNRCGPVLIYKRADREYTKKQALGLAIEDIKDGKIVAIKGIGGYHFACLPQDTDALLSLRKKKGRDFKPFAIMFRDMDEILKVCSCTDEEAALLQSPARPIVLLPIKDDPFAKEAICGLDRCGCFLPYTPLHEMIMKSLPCLVMTSANVSSSPIITDDDAMKRECEFVLYNKREIVRSIEDSVVQAAPGNGVQIIRRARGFVPLARKIKNHSGEDILAMGADLKAVFSVSKGEFVTMSPFFGDLENADVMKRYKMGIYDYLELLDVSPKAVVCDAHPGYFSAHMARQLSQSLNAELMTVQHHHAHIASVIAEKCLGGKVIGVAFDGAGYGEDGNIWGGEFFICEGASCRRVSHLKYSALLGADASSKDAMAVAACYLHDYGMEFSHPEKELIKAALSNGQGTFLSSSAGRLFDAVAAITGICRQNSYEGQCAMMLQSNAQSCISSGDEPVLMSFSKRREGAMMTIGCEDIIEKSKFYSQKKPSCGRQIALGFHMALADMVSEVCKELGERESAFKVALSGGVFQNTLLLSLCVDKLSQNGFKVYFNSDIPPNDGGIAPGQSYIAAGRIKRCV